MAFSTYTFLCWFLPATLGVYALLPARWRNAWLALASYAFYGWWRFDYCALLLALTAFNFLCGRRIARGAARRRKAWLQASVAGSLALLAFFKYGGMFADWLDALLSLARSDAARVVPVLDVVLPVGISFFTFQALSYTVDVYRGEAREARSFVDFAAYIALFPQLVAGPIVRYAQVEHDLLQRDHGSEKWLLGARFFVLGLAKKVLLADTFALGVPAAFGGGSPGFLDAWTGSLSYALQLYFDFSGYSDMAVGLGLGFGFRFPQNFNSPYKSISITDFWRRWHLSLSSWLRDYLYIPLGGSRRGPLRTYANLFSVMLLGGLWHGASAMFLAWGAWHGLWLALERALGERHPLQRAPRWCGLLSTHLLVLLGWVAFRSEGWGQCFEVLRALFGFGSTPSAFDLRRVPEVSLFLLPLGYLVCLFTPNTWELTLDLRPRRLVGEALACTLALLAVLTYRAVPFLYFQF